MTRSSENPWLHRFALLAAGATLFLIWMGGLVTSHGVGMAVPDWPTTYGYNMFLFPIRLWQGGIFYEHSHRLVASAVGLLTVMLAVWLWMKEERRWVRALGLAAVITVVVQGVLGGLRVTAMKDVLGVFHATLAQLFFALVCVIALVTSKGWSRAGFANERVKQAFTLPGGLVLLTGLILVQLMLGALMRHQHAGLAIPDFPTAYGRWWPDMDAASISKYNQARGEVRAFNPITAGGILLQMAHRGMALLIVLGVAWVAGATLRRFDRRSLLGRLALAWLGLIVVQVCLGAVTIWTNKAADIATAHVALGALSLVTGVCLSVVAARCARAARSAPGVRDSSLTKEPVRFDARGIQISA